MTNEEVKRLFIQYYAKMYRVAQTFLYDEQESKDVVSGIFARLLCGKVELLPETEERYLMTSVRNQCIKRLSHYEATRKLINSYSADEDEEAEDLQIEKIVEFATHNLTEQQFRIFNLRFSKGCSYEEIASFEGISKVAVWKHLSRLLNIIRNNFNSSRK